MERKNAWRNYDETELKNLEALSLRYRRFLDDGKTERECVALAVALAEKKGYKSLADVIETGIAPKPGEGVYVNVMGKAVLLFLMGKAPLEKGVNIVGAHVDSPRLDIK